MLSFFEIVISGVLPLLLLGLFAQITYFYYKYFTRPSPLPGPFPLPLIGNLHQFSGDPSDWANELHAKYGDMWEVYICTERQVWIGRADLAEKLFSPLTNSNYFLRTTYNEGLNELGLLNEGLVFNQNFNDWHYNKKILDKNISSPNFIRQSILWTQEVFKDLDQYWNALGEDCVMEFPEWMSRFFIDTTFLVFSNKRGYSLTSYYNRLFPSKKIEVKDDFLKESDAFVTHSEGYDKSMVYFFFIPTFIRHFPGMNLYTRHMLSHKKWLKDNLFEQIRERQKEIRNAPKDQKLSPDLLTAYLTTNDEHDKPLADDIIVGSYLEAVSGGIQTPANYMCFIVYYLDLYPHFKQRVFRELDEVFGQNSDVQITYDDLTKLEFCEAVIKEVGRFCSTVPVNFRVSSKPDEIGGLKFPAYTLFGINVQAIHMNKLHWKNPEIFDPNRFLSKDSEQSKKPLLNFGWGTKICPGRKLAISEMKILIASMYRKYDIKVFDKNTPLKSYSSSI
ncbi:10259_t:CDS:2, partial [Ambispora leptoticha]